MKSYSKRPTILVLLFCAVSGCSCGDGPAVISDAEPAQDASLSDAQVLDAESGDASQDATADVGEPIDAGTEDGGSIDASNEDAGLRRAAYVFSTSGGGHTRSSNHSLQLRVAGPLTGGETESPGHRLQLRTP